MADGQGVSAIALGSIASGIILVWSGLKGASVLQTVQELIQGKKPSGTQTNPITSTSPPPTNPSSGGGAGGSPSPPGNKAPGDLSGNPGGGDPGYTLPQINPDSVLPPLVAGVPPVGMTGAPPWAR